MLQFFVIGNLGGDAEVKEANGRKFVSFRVGHNDVWTDEQGARHESTTWVSCALNGDGGSLLPYLKRGQQVYVSGRGSARVYSSPTERRMVAGLNLSVDKIELVGGRPDGVPRELISKDGAVIRTNKAFFVDPKELESLGVVRDGSGVLFDKGGRSYRVEKQGLVVGITDENAAYDGF